ncbi:hypothetical protein FOA52_000822 [Chlamydomonas sp. UWO 241]|nr:hypothetical protein FOA52_000822 [Chlamydomonas sp. UWO 241]
MATAGRQGAHLAGHPVLGPQVWTASDARASASHWTHILSPGHLAELEGAVEGILSGGRATVDGNYVRLAQDMTAADFALPTLGPLLASIRLEVTAGRGFALVKGMPVERWSRQQTIVAYYGIGLHWGTPRPQNKKAHLVGHVKDVGIDPDHKDPNTRIYLTRVAQPYHVDSCDLVGLLCLKPAKEGGLSSWASSFAAYNLMLERHPRLAQVLAEPSWYLDRKGEVPSGCKPHFMIPIVNNFQGHLIVYLNDTYYQLAQRHVDVPRMTDEQHEALITFVALLSGDELRVDYSLEPGDLQLLNNHCCIHTRTAYVDHEDPAIKRHLLRLWVAPPEEHAWPLPECFAEQYGTTAPGDRGGIRVAGYDACVPLEAE